MSKTLPKISMAAAPIALLLAGCANVEGNYPSLSKRDYESADPLAEPVALPPAVSTTLPAELQAAVDSLLTRTLSAQGKFDQALQGAASVAQAAAGSTKGSEAWVNAHVQVSRADSVRADAVAALGEIDRLIAGQRDKGVDAGVVALLSAKQGQVAALVNAQNAEVERLAKLIGL